MTEMMRFQVCVHVCVCSAFVGGVRSMFFKSDLNGFRDYTVDDLLPVSDVSVKSYEHFMVVRRNTVTIQFINAHASV